MACMRCGVTTRISMPRSSSPQPERGSAAEPIPLFDQAGPSLRPDLRAARAARAGSLKAGRRPPPAAARSGLDRREHAAPIASGRNRIIPLDQQQSIFETAASRPPQDEDKALITLRKFLILRRPRKRPSRRTHSADPALPASALLRPTVRRCENASWSPLIPHGGRGERKRLCVGGIRCDHNPMVPLSVLDLSPITEGGDAGQALRNSPDLARWGPIRRSG